MNPMELNVNVFSRGLSRIMWYYCDISESYWENVVISFQDKIWGFTKVHVVDFALLGNKNTSSHLQFYSSIEE